MSGVVLGSRELSVGYGKKVAVSGLSFEVGKGEILTLIGPNGAGKTTILKTIAAQLAPISGEASINGANVSDMSAGDVAKTLSVCFTERIAPEKTTCEDVVSAGRYPYTGRLGILSAKDREIVRGAMELTGVACLRDTDIRRVSDGQRQTVMLARAIAQEPRILVLDEPTSFLDINNKLRLLSLLRDLAREKEVSVIMSLHELDLAQRFSDKILCVKGNKADRIGAPEEIFSGDYISGLYGITGGTFLPAFGAAEAPRAEGEPQVFVIGGGGSGIPVYRRLQRRGVPFAAGVIHENDVEYPIAESLAAELVSEKAFEPISDESLQKALKIMEKCGEVVCLLDGFGSMNAGNALLLKKARELGKI